MEDEAEEDGGRRTRNMRSKRTDKKKENRKNRNSSARLHYLELRRAECRGTADVIWTVADVGEVFVYRLSYAKVSAAEAAVWENIR